MTRLAPNLRDTSYRQLVESAVAQLPGLAPQWTDYNAHDPGIAIMELLAWTTEAQIYSLARSRRGERSGYAKLLGHAPQGATPARAVIWPRHEDATRVVETVAIGSHSRVYASSAPDLSFVPEQDIHVLAAHITNVRSIGPGDEVVEHGDSASGGMSPFLPFGHGDAEGWRLQIEVVSNTNNFIFEDCSQTPCTFAIGFEIREGIVAEISGRRSLPDVFMSSGSIRRQLHVKQDSTNKLRRTGIMLVTVDDDPPPSTDVTLEFFYPRGSGHQSAITRVTLNAIPVRQVMVHVGEAHVAQGIADETIRLQHGFLVTDGSGGNVTVKTSEDGQTHQWSIVDELAQAAPTGRVFSLDIADQTLTFGNGVNGKCLPAQAEVLVSYVSSEGAAGNVAAGTTWRIDGAPGLQFLNITATSGGADVAGLEQRQIAARRSAKSASVFSRATDLEKAAEGLPDQNVQAAMIGVDESKSSSSALTLIALRRPSAGDNFALKQEPLVWTQEIQAALMPRIPLGLKFIVKSVVRSVFTIRATCRIADSSDPAVVRRLIQKQLEARFGVAEVARDTLLKRFGRQLSTLDITGLLQTVSGIIAVEQVILRNVNGRDVRTLDVSLNGFAVLDETASSFTLLAADGGMSS